MVSEASNERAVDPALMPVAPTNMVVAVHLGAVIEQVKRRANIGVFDGVRLLGRLLAQGDVAFDDDLVGQGCR